MGEKRPSVRKLPTGEKVMHYPDGTQRLIPENKVDKFLAAIRSDTQDQVANLDTKMQRAVQDKIDSLDAGDAVPHDKRPL